MVEDRAEIRKDGVVFTWDPYTTPIIADVEGTIRFVDLVEEESLSEELDELTGLRQRVVIEDREKKLHPHIEIVQEKGGKEKRLRDIVVPVGAQLIVQEGDRVRAGDRLSEGPVNPHDILRIKGPRAVQEYLLNEVQEVYRLQGVKINDKHIGVIVRQMLQKVRVMDSGDTEFLEAEHVDKQVFRDVNDRTKKKKSRPAMSEPL